MILVAAVSARPVYAQTLSKGHRLLLERGIQLQAMVDPNSPFHIDTYRAAGLNGVAWIWTSDSSLLGPAPGFPWMRWTGSPADMPCTPSEQPFCSNLVAVQLGDEQDLNNPSVRTATAAWYASVRDRFPDALLYSNSYGGQLTNPSLDDFIRTSRPDMLSFDTYPFRPDGPTGGSPTPLYGDMQRYRKFALGYGVPYGMYTQTFHDYMTRDPSESEMRLNYFAGAAFGFTSFVAFTYNTGATSLFHGPGDASPKPGYAQLAEITRRLKALSPALTRLVSTDVRFINGQHRDPTTGAAANNPTPIDVQNWQFGVNDPYLRGWTISNLGSRNDGLRGDMILSWFRLLDESFDGPGYRDEIYFMVTNGLSDREGSAADCRQEISLQFLFDGPLPTSLLQLNQDTGRADAVELPIIPNTIRRRLTLVLDGGTAELFKFHTGAPFVGAVETPPDIYPPSPVTHVAADGGVEQVRLTWTCPPEADFAGTLIRRKQGSPPDGPTDGTPVADLSGQPSATQSHVETEVPGGLTWYYSLFARDVAGNLAGAATVAAVPRPHFDYDGDGDVDQTDYSFVQLCISGDRLAHPPGCEPADKDKDGDVDGADVLRFRACMQGPGRPPGC